jgi:hypothetical protein
MDFYFSFYHYTSGLNLVAAQWLDGVSLVPLFVIIWPDVLFTEARIVHTLNKLIPFVLKK